MLPNCNRPMKSTEFGFYDNDVPLIFYADKRANGTFLLNVFIDLETTLQFG